MKGGTFITLRLEVPDEEAATVAALLTEDDDDLILAAQHTLRERVAAKADEGREWPDLALTLETTPTTEVIATLRRGAQRAGLDVEETPLEARERKLAQQARDEEWGERNYASGYGLGL